MNRHQRDYVRVLERRATQLQARLPQYTGRSRTYTEHELAATLFALRVIKNAEAEDLLQELAS